MSKEKVCAVYVTAPDLIEARNLSTFLLQKRLGACTNIFKMESAYWWKGRICRAYEFAIIIKTKKKLVPELLREIKKRHSYEVPCICAWDIVSGNPEYLKWIVAETK